MKYERIVSAKFIERPNRFIAYVDVLGKKEKVHVKNTGRCRELLIEGTTVYLETSDNPNRSTKYDLVAVCKGDRDRVINIDSQAPNKVVEEWLRAGGLYKDIDLVRPETTFHNSRFDFLIQSLDGRKAFVEVKGVTLERDNIAYFPDAPSDRAVKHIEELIEAVSEGYEAYLIFVIQMKEIKHVEPNWVMQPEFGAALQKARNAGVHILSYDCIVAPDTLKLDLQIPVVIDSLDRIAEPLMSWYDKGRRVLPWREEPTPYHVWISEIMLQQTRVEAVKPYYDRFLSALPDVESLAQVDDEKLLKLWEGLGYYNRVRNLKKAAQIIIEEFDGILPNEKEELCKLPGIGSYTAGAISSIAYGKPEVAVDGNVLRVLSRLRADDRDILDAKVKLSVEEDLHSVIPKERAGDFNQALMELGAMVCIPHGTAKCEVCPWEHLCKAKEQGNIDQYPKKKAKKQRTVEKKTVLVIQDEGKIAIRQRPPKGLLAGLYEFPMIEGHLSEKEVIEKVKDMGFHVLRIRKLADYKHIFTHKEWHMTGYVIRVDELETLERNPLNTSLLFIEPDETESNYPIPSAFAMYADFTEMKRGPKKR